MLCMVFNQVASWLSKCNVFNFNFSSELRNSYWLLRYPAITGHTQTLSVILWNQLMNIASYLLRIGLVCSYIAINIIAVIYWLTMATITFSKQYDAATKWGWLLTLCRNPEQQYLYSTYVLEVTCTLYQIAS